MEAVIYFIILYMQNLYVKLICRTY